MTHDQPRPVRRRTGIAAALLLVVGLLVVATASAPAQAAGDDYPYRGQGTCTGTVNSSGGCSTSGWRINGSEFDPWGFAYRNCTSFVTWRMRNTNGVDFYNGMSGGRWGNANNWDDNARRLGYAVNGTPAVGAIAQTDAGTYGHVAWVSAVGNGTVTVEQYNKNFAGAYSTQTHPVGAFNYIHVRDLPTNNAPIGSFDEVSSPAPGVVRVRGWAFDPDAPGQNIRVHVYVGGPAGVGAGHDAGPTGVSRPDVQRVHAGAGPNAGFDVTVQTGGGDRPVYVYAIDAQGGHNPIIGSRTVRVANPDPHGSVDEVVSKFPGLVDVRGWTSDPNDRNAQLRVHVYVGGPVGSGAPGYDVGPTWLDRPDVPAAIPGAGPRTGFSSRVPAPAGDVRVFVYAINVGPGGNPLLGERTVRVAPGPAAYPRPEAALYARRRGGDGVQLSWDGRSARPSAVTFDVRVRSRGSRPGSSWSGWTYPRALQDTITRSAVLGASARRSYQFQARVRADVLGRPTGVWSAPVEVR